MTNYNVEGEDSGFLGLHQRHYPVGVAGEEVVALGLEFGMYPVHGNLAAVILDPMPGLGIVADNLAPATAAVLVNLEEDGRLVLGYAQAVLTYQPLDGFVVKQGSQECYQGPSERIKGLPSRASPGHS